MSNFPSLEEFNSGVCCTISDKNQNESEIQDETFIKPIPLKDIDAQREDMTYKISENTNESVFLEKWKQQREANIQKQEEEDRLKKENKIENAKKAIDNFFESYNRKKQEKIQKNREKQKEFLLNRDKDISGMLWDRVVKLLNLSETSTGLEDSNMSKFKELLLKLQKDPNAPGANDI
ncbi:hypothetical protein PNEG_02779 [Pneumocystis murina B123]|uniref:Clathrin light chain n=1 Tax=Pneumocystis murina (strain B123) TaxID=1069680 RepID=M7PEW2_PNEMU|nr:hypothetical protein PNEG_02779 [Pneumocystis murina B123]EMR09004.1 hypothetical protein PNEG_02779 [Pneumocystis murina B123]